MKKINLIYIFVFLFLVSSMFVSAVITDNLVGYWRLDDNVASPVDVLGKYNLTKGGNPTFLTNAKINGGQELNSTKYLYSPTITELSGTSDFCIAMWLNWNGTVVSSNFPYSWLFQIGEPTGAVYPLGVTSGTNTTNLYSVQQDGTLTTSTAYQPKVNASYHHYIFCRDYTNSKFYTYQDGVILLNESATRRNPAGSFSLVLGTSRNFGSGILERKSYDEVGLWTKILSLSEVTQLYNSGSGVSYPFVNQYIYFNDTVTPSTNTYYNSTHNYIEVSTYATYPNIQNVTQFLYFNDVLINYSNSTAGNFTTNFTGLSTGTYKINATVYNSSNSTSTETRTVYINLGLLNITAKDFNGNNLTTFNVTLIDLNTSATQTITTTTGNITSYQTLGNIIEAHFYGNNIATSDNIVLANYDAVVNINMNSTWVNWTQYLPFIQYDLWFSSPTNVTIKQESLLTGELSYINITNITINLNNYEVDKYVYVFFGENQQYVIYNSLDEYRNISLYLQTLDTSTTTNIISSGVQVDRAKIEVYSKTSLLNGSRRLIYATLTEDNGYADLLINSGVQQYTIVVSKEGYITKTVEKTFIAGSTLVSTINIEKESGGTGQFLIYTNCWTYGITRVCDMGTYTTTKNQLVYLNYSGNAGYTGSSLTNSTRKGYVTQSLIINSSTNPVFACARVYTTESGWVDLKCIVFKLYGVDTSNTTKYYNGTVDYTNTPEIDNTEENLIIFTIIILLFLIYVFAVLEGYMNGLGVWTTAILSLMIGFKYYPIWIGVGMFPLIYIIYDKFRKIYTTN